MKEVKRFLGAAVHTVLACGFLFVYALGARHIAAAGSAYTDALVAAYRAGAALAPALYLRAVLAMARRTRSKKQNTGPHRFAPDAAGIAALVCLLVFGAWGIASRRADILEPGLAPYYFTALWLALLCCVHRKPAGINAPRVDEADGPEPDDVFFAPPAPRAPFEQPPITTDIPTVEQDDPPPGFMQ